jgi:hypothetical protein
MTLNSRRAGVTGTNYLPVSTILDTLSLVLETEVLPVTVFAQLFTGRGEQKGT